MSLDYLKKTIYFLEKQLFLLNDFYQKTEAIELNKPVSVENINYYVSIEDINYYISIEAFNHYENLCDCFTCNIDFLTHKVFVAIDEVEFADQNKLIDIIDNAYRRKLFSSADIIIEIMELRNDIVVYKCLNDDLLLLFFRVKILTPKLIAIIDNTLAYTKKIIH
jgi:hypothetical protein